MKEISNKYFYACCVQITQIIQLKWEITVLVSGGGVSFETWFGSDVTNATHRVPLLCMNSKPNLRWCKYLCMKWEKSINPIKPPSSSWWRSQAWSRRRGRWRLPAGWPRSPWWSSTCDCATGYGGWTWGDWGTRGRRSPADWKTQGKHNEEACSKQTKLECTTNLTNGQHGPMKKRKVHSSFPTDILVEKYASV